MERIYRVLLRLYPYDFRFWLSAGMLHDVAQSAASARASGRAAFLLWATRELAELLRGCAAEWFAKFTGDAFARSSALSDWRMMRPASISKEAWFAVGVTEGRCSSDT